MARTVADYMEENARLFYSQPDVIGRKGCFVTAPELTQIFGELVGASMVFSWHRNDTPSPVQVVELGPGRGTMMYDILSTIYKIAPQMYKVLHVVLVENSPNMASIQKKTLGEFSNKITWVSEVREIPDIPFLLVANEFFDCLPVHQLVKTADGFIERMVEDDCFTASEKEPDYLFGYMARQHFKAKEGDIIEVCPQAVAIINFLAERMRSYKSSALIIDYGYVEPQVGSTLQSVCDHEKVDVFSNFGRADLTAHVDFSALRSAAISNNASIYGPIAQGIWLKQMGIEERAAKILRLIGDPEERRRLEQSVFRLLDFDQMGRLFKVLAMYSKL